MTTTVEAARAVAAGHADLTLSRVLQIEHGVFTAHGSAELIVTRARQLSSDDDRARRECF